MAASRQQGILFVVTHFHLQPVLHCVGATCYTCNYASRSSYGHGHVIQATGKRSSGPEEYDAHWIAGGNQFNDQAASDPSRVVPKHGSMSPHPRSSVMPPAPARRGVEIEPMSVGAEGSAMPPPCTQLLRESLSPDDLSHMSVSMLREVAIALGVERADTLSAASLRAACEAALRS
eukprot:jgi/Mesvir1/23442/Mv22297-RA.1